MSSSKLLNTLILAALAVPSVALAGEASPFTANVGLTSDYIFRGISQTSGGPAVQGGFDFAHSSGFHAGVWASNVSWISDFTPAVSSSVEVDTYFGFGGSFAEDFSYDVGYVRYNYPGSNFPAGFVKADTDEVYGSLGYKWITAKYSYGLGDFLGVAGAQGTNYLELNASVPLGETGITLGAHYGKQTYKGTAADALTLAGTSPTYSDYKLSVSKNIGDFSFALAYSDTNSPKGGFYTTPAPASKDLARGTAALTVSRAF